MPRTYERSIRTIAPPMVGFSLNRFFKKKFFSLNFLKSNWKIFFFFLLTSSHPTRPIVLSTLRRAMNDFRRTRDTWRNSGSCRPCAARSPWAAPLPRSRCHSVRRPPHRSRTPWASWRTRRLVRTQI